MLFNIEKFRQMVNKVEANAQFQPVLYVIKVAFGQLSNVNDNESKTLKLCIEKLKERLSSP